MAGNVSARKKLSSSIYLLNPMTRRAPTNSGSILTKTIYLIHGSAKMDKHVLVTGGCGFIGSNFIRHMLATHPYGIINFDKLTYAGNPENLQDIEKNSRYTFIKGDIAEVSDLEKAFEIPIETVVNFAAESHVDRSILDPYTFIKTN